MSVVPITRSLLIVTLLLIPGRPVRAGVPNFKMQEIDKTLKIGYGVVLADINGDGKPDIVVADKDRVIWFENPSWQLHTIIGAKTKLDNVCLAAADIDGDGKIDIALGAGWRPPSTTEPATLQWLGRGASLEAEWTLHPINYDHPSLHRIRFADLNGDGRPELIVAPLHGKGATAGKNWAEAGPRFGYLTIPQDPTSANWEFKLIDDTKHVMHNFLPTDYFDKKTAGLLTASYEGVFYFTRSGEDKWVGAQLGQGNQADPTKSRGSSEIKVGRMGGANGAKFITTIEPFHGNEVVVYTPPIDPKTNLMQRTLLDNRIKSGHALWCADLDGDGTDEIVMGFRDPFNGMINYGINIFHVADPAAGGAKVQWEKTNLDNGGVAVEDLLCGDLNGDGRPDIVAVGRATKNVRIYWNEGK
jgi:hypothetical protein